MPTIQRALVIRKHMGGSIYWDSTHHCYRVCQWNSPSIRRPDHHLLKVEE